MIRYVNADKLWEEIDNEDIYTDFESACIFKMVREKINNAPTADVEEVKHGVWLESEPYSNGMRKFMCSCCSRTILTRPGRDLLLRFPYCHCGARMQKEQEE